MIPRKLTGELLRLLEEYPIVTVLGPRQAGKTTLVRHALAEFSYVNLERPDIRAMAQEDPLAFLERHDSRVILDEIQRVPELLSYLQVLVDERGENGQFVLTGSHQLELRAAIGQSLAGRAGILNLFPFSIDELAAADIRYDDFAEYLFRGFLPRIYDQDQRPQIAHANYYRTYVERDVRQLVQLKDASLFEKFVKLLAGRTGQLANCQSLAGDVGVDGKTIKHWLSILEASFLILELPPYFENFGKRVIKSPKYYFTDTGFLAYLLGIEAPDQVRRDPLVGQMFENLVVLEAFKARLHAGKAPNLYFFRDARGHEIDLLWQRGRELVGIEIKSASTWHASFRKSLLAFHELRHELAAMHVVYSGEDMAFSDGTDATHFARVASIF